MSENELRCPQCGSPVLATANYCVICGVRLPDRVEIEVSGPSGWDTPRPERIAAQPIPPLVFPEFDDEDDEATELEVAVEPAAEVSAESFASIPVIELDDLDAFIAQEPASDVTEGEITEEELEIEEMIEEGGPVFDETEAESIIAADSEVESIDMIDEGAPVVPDESEPEGDDDAPEMDADVEEMVSEGGPIVTPDPVDDVTFDDGIESDEEAIEMIDEGGPAFDDETAPEPESPDRSEPTAAVESETDLAESMLTHDPDPAPMISASYPEGEPSTGESIDYHSGDQHWWPEDSDDDWVYFEPEQAVSGIPSDEPVASVGTASDTLARANALVDELKAMLPSLGSQTTATPPDLSELRAIAIASRGERSFDDWAALRNVIGAAAGRPTDIETILQLSKRVEDIAALIAERDRLQSAFKQITDWLESNLGE